MKRLRFVITLLLSICGLGGIYMYFLKKTAKCEKNAKKKFQGMYQVLAQWLILKYHNADILEYYRDNCYHKIAVYGMTPLADCLYEELKDTDVRIEYFIDKSFEKSYEPSRVGIDMVGIDEAVIRGNVDAIIVTVISQLDGIRETLKHAGIKAPIIPISEMLTYCQQPRQ